ncbi:3-oxoacyl-ACP synthase [Oceanotoga teriensis]|uniref:3-oxoacyl-ACP synthase n=2 Tax=Oceanotoga TaxID=1255275 RepID=UPI002650E80E|nr:3-oxoacyl-ACP synthase [Oceanotoga teriensis]MDN5342957.1 3-oxoacyl-[acyl-carrier-protein] synthase [Oceanotoga sp.]MDO7975312.1 3-oxoacyl-ACP synthase [Oceanotoga teriensis]
MRSDSEEIKKAILYQEVILMNIGIMGLGTYCPENYISSAEIAEKTGIPEWVISQKFGVDKKTIPGPKDTTSYMGIQAAKEAIKEAGIDPKEIDIVIWNGAQHKDYPCWLASLKVAEEIGAVNAWGFDMEAMCGSMMVGMETASSLLKGNENYKTALLVSGYRNSDLIDYSVAETSFMFDIGVGGAAMVLRKGYNKNVILGTAFKGDGSFSEDCVVEVGGSKNWPMTEEDVKDMHFVVRDAESFKKKLGERTMPNFYHVIRESLSKSGRTDKDIDYLAILHFKKSAHDAVLDELGLDSEQTTYLNEYGHIGQNDQVLSIKLGLESGKIKDGDIVVMVGAGIGFVWAAATVQWGDYVG